VMTILNLLFELCPFCSSTKFKLVDHHNKEKG
jgi:hypothetical protein